MHELICIIIATLLAPRLSDALAQNKCREYYYQFGLDYERGSQHSYLYLAHILLLSLKLVYVTYVHWS